MSALSRKPEARLERDSFGVVEVPATALYGANTVRALQNVLSSGPRLRDRQELLRAFAHVKAAAAEANAELGLIERRIAEAIVAAADEVADGHWHDQFELAVVQGGGGTATNIVVNEVLANRAAQLLGSKPGSYDTVHPLDHVNRSQSTNDVYPTALQIAVVDRVGPAFEALEFVGRTLDDLGAAAGDLLRLGRTCLQDAVPVPISSYHRSQARAVRRAATALRLASDALYAIPLGATAVGTGVGAPSGYGTLAVERLAARTGLDLRPALDFFDALAHLDPLSAVISAASSAAITLAKIASDLRLLSSGPVGGIGEISLPTVQLGSSIMPGKVNPVIPELVIQASFEIRGAASVIEAAVAAGELDLNVMEPVIARHLLEGLAELEGVAKIFVERCLAGLQWNKAAVIENLAGSLEADVEEALLAGHDAIANPE